MNTSVRIIVTDLDGTLLPSQGVISQQNIATLESLAKQKVLRVIATGRTLYSALSVLPAQFPIDYLIFSSGAGIMKWENKEIIFSQKLEAKEVSQIAEILMDHQIDFMIQNPIPLNHQFQYFRSGKKNPDFSRRLSLYKEFATPIGNLADTQKDACQFLVILPNNLELYNELRRKFTDIKIIRATSPLDHESIWMEIFPENISKGHSCDWLCKKLNIPIGQTMGIGNDYNDIDLLEWSHHSYVVANAPGELRNRFRECPSDLEDGFTKAVLDVLNTTSET
jgi:Cof subfamily protein (haloacid dehalogenase superfamily)